MFERIYAWLWSLQPSGFRERYADEAMQLLRDRAGDERGVFAAARLWFDLLTDLAVSVTRGYAFADSDWARASGGRPSTFVPSFWVQADEKPRNGALVAGGLLSVVTLFALPTIMSQFRSPVPSVAPADRPQPQRVAASQQPPRPSAPQAPTAPGKVGADERRRVVDEVAAKVESSYFDPEAGRKIAEGLREREQRGDYAKTEDGSALAEKLTKDLRELSGDPRMDVVFTEAPFSPAPPSAAPEARANYAKAMQQENCTFEKVEILPRNIGYVKLNSFPDLTICQPTAMSAMATVNNADAIIFDLRGNRGGYPNMVRFIASYLFDHPEYLYNPRENTTRDSWTQSPVPGNKLADKPVYVLTSGMTASGAEQFSYDLKMLRRATLVGETTRGAAHSGEFFRLNEHFGMGIQQARPINPFSNRDWDGVGVEADVKVPAAEALEKAKALAMARGRK